MTKSIEDHNNGGLDPRATKLIDKHLKARVIQAFIVVGIVNVGVLFGIYTFVSEKAAEIAVKKAITSTESQLQGLTKQFDQLSKRTTDGFANALMSLGEAKARVDEIDRDVLSLSKLDLKHVNEVTKLLNRSSDDIRNVIESNKVLGKIEKIKSGLSDEVSNLRKIVQDSRQTIDDEISKNSNLMVMMRDYNSITKSAGTTVYSVGEVLIETGKIFFPRGSHISYTKFRAEFKDDPTIVVTTESDSKYDYGYAIIGDISVSGFQSTLSDKISKNGNPMTKTGGIANYIAIGQLQKKGSVTSEK